MTNNYFSNLGLTNRKNIEATFMGFQNTTDRFNDHNQDSFSLEENNLIAKVDQWSPLTGRTNMGAQRKHFPLRRKHPTSPTRETRNGGRMTTKTISAS